jgi:hypothetical protein
MVASRSPEITTCTCERADQIKRGRKEKNSIDIEKFKLRRGRKNSSWVTS